MKVLFVASECAPFVKTGGLADVIGAVPKALTELGLSVRILLPSYPELDTLRKTGSVVQRYPDLFGGEGELVAVSSHGLDLLLLNAPHLFNRDGTIYQDSGGNDWTDNHRRFGALSLVGARIAQEGVEDWAPDVVNAHDWQAGLLPAYLYDKSKRNPPVVMTVHNIAFQGVFSSGVVKELGISEELFNSNGVEYFGKLSFLKAGLALCDKISTVSPTYARELLLPEFGMGMDGLLRSRQADLTGILNGIDITVWDPAKDAELKVPYTSQTYKRKAENRQQLEARFDLKSNSEAPLFCVVSRLTEQKGLDLLLECLPALVSRGARLAVLGTGQKNLERAFIHAAKLFSGSVGVIIGYDEALSHQMQGGSDAILIPSRFEPCGLTQLYGLRYGTLPVVSRTGGLADTVIDANEAALVSGCATGFQFSPVNAVSLDQAIARACKLFRDTSAWSTMVGQAMSHPVGWDQSATAYHSLYAKLLSPR